MFVRDKSLMPVIDLFLRFHAVNLGFFSKYQIRFLAQSTQCNIGTFHFYSSDSANGNGCSFVEDLFIMPIYP